MSNCHQAKPRSIAWNTPWNTRKSEHARKKPEGGFCFIPAMAILRAWRAYKGGIIRLYDLRVWFACFEAVARRCDVAPNRFPRYTKEEIHRLVGGRHSNNIQTAVRRLSNAGLLAWSERRIRFLNLNHETAGGEDLELERMVELVSNHRRKVPVPRRTIRCLAKLTRPVAIATVLGHLLRCLYYRNGLCEPCGRCKASWIADVFDVDIRNVKAARHYLHKVGWLVVEKSRQFVMNRWGAAITIQLAWGRERRSPPPERESTTGSPPPYKDRELSSRSEDQKPAGAGRTGASVLPVPNLRNIRHEDLSDPERLNVLFEEARQWRFVTAGDASRLRFHAAAAHAIRVGKRNHAGLFATMVRRRLWSYLSAIDEDQARRSLANDRMEARRHEHHRTDGMSRGAAPTPARSIVESIFSALRLGTTPTKSLTD